MKETLEFILSGFWNYTGTVFLIYAVGHSLAVPLIWLFKLKELRLTKSVWPHKSN